MATLFTALFAYSLSRNFIRCLLSSDCDQSILDIIDDGWAEVTLVIPVQGTRAARARMFEPGADYPQMSPRQLVYRDELPDVA